MKKICTFMLALMLVLGTVCSAGLSAYAASGGWQQSTSGAWYYYNTDGTAQTGWKKVSSKWYYFNSNGIMQTGWQTIGGTTYYFNTSGAMTTGWQKVNGTWYYMNSSGAMTTGWQKISGKWYYFEADGAMATGWEKIGGTTYYFNTSGAMTTGWQKVNGTWYYMNSSGAMTTGWQKVNGTWYYLKSNGAMACNETLTVDGTVYTFDASGIYSTAHTHTWVAATCTTPKTCSVCGATEGSALGHSWYDTTETRTVEVPGETVEALYCMGCSGGPFFSKEEWLAHCWSAGHTSFYSGTYTYPGTTTTETVTTGRTCSVCGAHESY